MSPDRHLYEPLLRPAGFETLPSGLEWEYVEAPDYVRRPDLPLSRRRHGVIATKRPLTSAEIDRFPLRAL